MLIPRNITFDELKALHQETADRVETALSALEGAMENLNAVRWLGSLRNRETQNSIASGAHNVMSCALELGQAQDDLDRINKKRLKMVRGES